jgi:hypothetical protein
LTIFRITSLDDGKKIVDDWEQASDHIKATPDRILIWIDGKLEVYDYGRNLLHSFSSEVDARVSNSNNHSEAHHLSTNLIYYLVDALEISLSYPFVFIRDKSHKVINYETGEIIYSDFNFDMFFRIHHQYLIKFNGNIIYSVNLLTKKKINYSNDTGKIAHGIATTMNDNLLFRTDSVVLLFNLEDGNLLAKFDLELKKDSLPKLVVFEER